jgi:hypothetical protein
MLPLMLTVAIELDSSIISDPSGNVMTAGAVPGLIASPERTGQLGIP